MSRPFPRCSGPLSRRSFLTAGSLGLGGLGLADLLRLRAEAAARQPAGKDDDTAIIFVWLPGGPPHMEMYDMKPDAPAEYRGPFRPIATNVAGIDVCELMPRHAQIADKYNIIRSVAHEFSDHGGGHKRFLTGRDPLEPTGFVNDFPMAGSVVAKVRANRRTGVPNYICGSSRNNANVDAFSFGAAYLGSAYTPYTFTGDPSDAKFKVQDLAMEESVALRLEDRAQLLSSLDRMRRQVDNTGALDAMDKYSAEAIDLLLSPQMRNAFDLSQESDELKDRYGRHAWGFRALLARRLVEAGSSFVTVVMENAHVSPIRYPKDGVFNWDSHAVNGHIFNDALVRLPIYDQAITALVEDLYNRGLDKRVLLVVTGEFGRTPRISYGVGSRSGVMQPGRDHWPQAMSMLVAGGGMRTGQVIGSTNAKGEHPQDRPLTPNDLWATVYRHLGIDYTQSFPNMAGRPMPILPYGEPISELL
ncbi:DUF1501 domain-containing protein [Lignipirellula cremea]|uniref:DUF1501 domain-containing protein n=1 Tax=Lignipirellula cremea TaxID=2528010 RepID=A0A518DVX9_9BACT|nr:DUF1501 domain-containing protein [Lignipirellula cremea]QDU95996.1 hypothetical protein Pla8534_38150 [Lignipirellula cremea]